MVLDEGSDHRRAEGLVGDRTLGSSDVERTLVSGPDTIAPIAGLVRRLFDEPASARARRWKLALFAGTPSSAAMSAARRKSRRENSRIIWRRRGCE